MSELLWQILILSNKISFSVFDGLYIFLINNTLLSLMNWNSCVWLIISAAAWWGWLLMINDCFLLLSHMLWSEDVQRGEHWETWKQTVQSFDFIEFLCGRVRIKTWRERWRENLSELVKAGQQINHSTSSWPNKQSKQSKQSKQRRQKCAKANFRKAPTVRKTCSYGTLNSNFNIHY